jgi:murein DD-endopeptidase MepM/ murein hydrolase activator NlpD
MQTTLPRACCAVFLLNLCSVVTANTTTTPSTIPPAQGGATPNTHIHDHIDPAERAREWAEVDRNLIAIERANKSKPRATEKVVSNGFIWPIRNTKGNSDASYWVVVNFVDQNRATTGQLDYQCQRRTYDNHQGTDISFGFDAWNLMATSQIEVIAAAPGTITFRQDGNFDRNCVFSSKQWNAVYVQHDDGSIAVYGHFKTGSVTPKQVGERVELGEYLGAIGSSGNSTGPHLHFEVYDAQRRLIDPWAGQCNTLNVAANTTAPSWWQNQKPYSDPSLNRLYTASAPPTFSSCGADGTMSDPGTVNEKRNFKPGDDILVMGVYRDQRADQPSYFRVSRPDGSSWKEWAHTPAQSNPNQASYVSSYWYWNFTLEANAPAGTWMVEALFNDKIVTTSFTVTANAAAVPNYSSLWWNPAESGWGMNITQQSDILFAAWYTYDADNSGMWLVMPSTSLQPDGSYAGEIYRTTGIPLAQINNAASSTSVTSVGRGTFRFATPAAGTFNYTVNNVTQTKNIVRQTFGALPECRFTTANRKTLTNYQDLWWNPAESGWGMSLAHQGDTLFAAWFTYRADGKGQWLVGSNIARTPIGEYKGRLYRTTGVPFNNINMSQATTSVTDVGEITLKFIDGENAEMRYTVDQVSQTKSITRQTWASLKTICQ